VPFLLGRFVAAVDFVWHFLDIHHWRRIQFFRVGKKGFIQHFPRQAQY
jgi:hypothetical protein